jgi:hypothetical protein
VPLWRKALWPLIAAISIVVLFGTRAFCYRSGFHLARCFPFSALGSFLFFGGLLAAGLAVVFFLESGVWAWREINRRAASIFAPGTPPRISPAGRGAALVGVSTMALFVLLGLAWLRVWFGMSGDRTAFLEGVRDRLARDVDWKQLQNWAIGVMPVLPQKTGFPIHLPNGQTVNPQRDAYGEANIGADGSFFLSPTNLPPGINALFPDATAVHVRYDPNPSQNHVDLGFDRERFGLVIQIGATNYVAAEGRRVLRWHDGIYISIAAGG